MAQVEILTTANAAATGLTFSGVVGTATAAQTFRIWYNRGTASGTVSGLALQIEIEDPNNPGTYLSSGLAALDNKHVQMRINGQSATSFEQQATDWVNVGTNARLYVSPIPGNQYRILEVRYNPPLTEGAASESGNFRILPYYAVAAFGTADGVTQQGSGILTGVTDGTVREFVEIPTVTGSADVVTVSRRWWVYDGTSMRDLVRTHTLNQNDSAVSALTSGQAYKAVISQGPSGTSTATKGVRATAASAVAPSLPTGHMQIAVVTVTYQGGGTSSISSGNISVSAINGRFGVTSSGSSLNLTIGGGRALFAGTFIRLDSTSTVALTASSTNRVWLGSQGTFSVVTTDDLPPTSGALWICTATTNGSGVTALTDKRRFHEPTARLIALKKSGSEATGTLADYAVVPFRAQVDRLVMALGTASSGGATGSTTADVNLVTGGSSATLFTNQGGSPESRPTIAAGSYVDATAYPEVTATLEAGDLLTLDLDAITSGGSQGANLGVAVVLYPR